ncbi:MAG: DsbA family protein [Polyangiaceae bacterium]|nr:DsbA family protein [Polyangiaceae bacterium]
MPHSVSFSHWSDPLCIWALVGQSKLDRILRDLGGCLRVEYRIAPIFGSIPWRFAEGPWAKEGILGRIAATKRIAEQNGRSDVSGECWQRAAPATSWAPAAAIKAVFALGEGLGMKAGPAYQVALRERFFVAEQNIALRKIQLELAEEMNLPREPIEASLDDGSALCAVAEDYAEKERLRIQGSPTYIFDAGRIILYGNFNYEVLHHAVVELCRTTES